MKTIKPVLIEEPHPYDLAEKGRKYDALKERKDELVKALKLAKGMLNYVGCIQPCDGKGTLLSGEQCQWCDENNKIKQALKNNSND